VRGHAFSNAAGGDIEGDSSGTMQRIILSKTSISA